MNLRIIAIVLYLRPSDCTKKHNVIL